MRERESGPDILFVDDEPSVLHCVETALSPMGYRVHVTDDPREADRLMQAFPIALVILDIRMPRRHGFDIFLDLREKQGQEQIPILFLTAFTESFSLDQRGVMDLWRKHFSRGNTDILYKPFLFRTLLEKVESLVGSARDATRVAV